jgi:signal transduction histidine kinase
VVVAVSDSGPGLTPEQLTQVFDRYWQASDTAREGTGLGLYIARGIVEAHGGRIWAESAAGSGATFKFTLPLAAVDAPA